jgi:hypothetical protein
VIPNSKLNLSIASKFGLAMTTLLIVSSGAFADSFTFTSPGTVVWDSVYVNPYQANDNSQPAQNPLTIYCDDWNTEFSGDPTWDANIYTLSAANVPNFKYGTITSAESVTLNSGMIVGGTNNSPNPYNLYLEAADLDAQLQAYLAGPSPSNTVQDELAAAEWLIFVSSSNASGLISAINDTNSSVPGFATAVYNDLVSAQTAVADGFNGAGWDVIVPNDPGSMQEFMVYHFNGQTVPEPSAIILLGTIVGLLGLAQLRRRVKA